MPVYRYRNLTTNETFDHQQRITEPALTEHPATGDPVKRLIQPVGISFKGSGFYVNDSRSSSKPSSTSEKADKPEGAAKTDAANPTNPPASKPDKAASGKAESGKAESGKSAKSAGNDSAS